MARTLASAWVNVGPSGFATFGKVTQAKVKAALRNVSASVPVQANTTPATTSLDKLKARLEELAGKVATARLDADDKDAVAKLAAMAVKLDRLDRRVASPRITLEGAAAAEAEMLALDVSFDRLGSKAENLGGSAVSTGRDLGALSQFAMPAVIAAGVALSPVLVTTGVGMAGLGAAASKTIAPILAAGTATAAQQKALAGLDPAQRAAYTSLGALKTQFSGFAKALEPETIGLFDDGLGLAKDLLHDVAPVAASAGKGLGSVVGALAADLHSQQWQAFFSFMAQQAGPDIRLVGQAFLSLLNTLPQLLTQLQPVAVEMLTLVTDAGKLISITDQLATKEHALAQSANESGGWLGRLADAGKKAFLQMFPGVKVAGQLKDALDGQAKNAAKAGDATRKLATAQAAAQPSTTDLGVDVSILASYTQSAANQAAALSDAWDILVGNMAGRATAVLNAKGAIKAFGDAIKQSGAGSLVAQQAFEGAVTAIGQIIAADQKSHTPAKQVYNDIVAQYKALKDKGPLNKSERDQLDAIRKVLDVTAGSTDGWTKATKGAAQAIERSLLPDLSAMHVNTPKVRGDVDQLVNTIINTGTKSTATHDARQRLIGDLEKAGLSAKAAKGLVDNLQRSISGMHGKTVNVGVHGSGSGGVKIVTSGIAAAGQGNVRFVSGNFAAGGLVKIGSGPTADDVVARLSKGELVIPAGMVKAGAVDHLRGVLPGFASGGLVGMLGRVPGQVAGFAGHAAGLAELAAAKAAIAREKAALANSFAAVPVRNVGAGVARWAGVVRQALSMEHLNPNLILAVLYQMLTESGGNPNAINLSDINAQHGDPSRGLMQVIGSTFRAYHWPGTSGNIYDPLANVAAALNYARHRYGPSLISGGMGIGSGHGYALGGLVKSFDSGGWLRPG
jgi:hypothetical protein